MAWGPVLRNARDASAAGSLTFTANDDRICITGRGFFSDACIDRHFEQLGRVVLSARAAYSSFGVLVDMRDAAVQAPATSARVQNETRRMWTPEDRIAIVVRAGLSRMQLARIVDGRNHRTFDTIEQAREWLDEG